MKINWSSIPRIFAKANEQHEDRLSAIKQMPPPLSYSLKNKNSGKVPLLNKPRGSALIVSILIMAIFLTLGTGLLLNSGIFLQAQGFRKLNRLSAYASENGIKQALHRSIIKAEEISSKPEIEESQYQDIEKGLKAGELIIIQPLLKEATLNQEDEFSGMCWETHSSARFSEYISFEGYLRATFGLNIESTGWVQGFSGKKSEELLCRITLMAGHLPLNQLPLVVEKDELDKAVMNQIKIKNPDPANLIAESINLSSKPLIPNDALPLISRGLKIFKPEKLPSWLLRQALGLEPGNEKVAEGVYLIQDDLSLGGVYVQGDLDELLFGIDHGYQLIQFRQGEQLWLLKFNPEFRTAFFISAEGSLEFNELPIPIIMINGQVKSLAAGSIQTSGYLAYQDDEATPAFLSGFKITLVCSGQVNLTSNLYSEGLEWKKELPYLRSKQSQIIIWSTGKDFQTEELTDGGINLISETDKTRIIEANLIAGGHGLKTNSESEEIKLVGSLAAKALDLGKTDLTIFNFSNKTVDSTPTPDLLVCSETPLIYISELRILEWRPVR